MKFNYFLLKQIYKVSLSFIHDKDFKNKRIWSMRKICKLITIGTDFFLTTRTELFSVNSIDHNVIDNLIIYHNYSFLLLRSFLISNDTTIQTAGNVQTLNFSFYIIFREFVFVVTLPDLLDRRQVFLILSKWNYKNYLLLYTGRKCYIF